MPQSIDVFIMPFTSCNVAPDPTMPQSEANSSSAAAAESRETLFDVIGIYLLLSIFEVMLLFCCVTA